MGHSGHEHRSNFLTIMYDAGVDEAIVRYYMGHTQKDTSCSYRQATPTAARWVTGLVLRAIRIKHGVPDRETQLGDHGIWTAKTPDIGAAVHCMHVDMQRELHNIAATYVSLEERLSGQMQGLDKEMRNHIDSAKTAAVKAEREVRRRQSEVDTQVARVAEQMSTMTLKMAGMEAMLQQLSAALLSGAGGRASSGRRKARRQSGGVGLISPIGMVFTPMSQRKRSRGRRSTSAAQVCLSKSAIGSSTNDGESAAQEGHDASGMASPDVSAQAQAGSAGSQRAAVMDDKQTSAEKLAAALRVRRSLAYSQGSPSGSVEEGVSQVMATPFYMPPTEGMGESLFHAAQGGNGHGGTQHRTRERVNGGADGGGLMESAQTEDTTVVPAEGEAGERVDGGADSGGLITPGAREDGTGVHAEGEAGVNGGGRQAAVEGDWEYVMNYMHADQSDIIVEVWKHRVTGARKEVHCRDTLGLYSFSPGGSIQYQGVATGASGESSTGIHSESTSAPASRMAFGAPRARAPRQSMSHVPQVR